MTDLQDLKKEADELGVTYPKNISAEKLAVKIDEFYEAKETGAPTVIATPPTPVVDEVEDGSIVMSNPVTSAAQKRRDREKSARATRVITIVDNDQRVNNHTTTCTVNCSNEFFDLGTKVLPLNEKIEVSMGHIKTLQSVRIPLHVVDAKTGMASVRMRPRYTISFEPN